MKTITKEMQLSLTPTKAIEILKNGNIRFQNNLKANRNLLQQVNETSDEQNPFAAILSCIDSRTSAELIFDQGLGDIFSIRIAGNIINEDILGSLEFACKIVGAKVIMVLGHTKCGAIKGACDNVQLGHLTALLEKLKPVLLEEKTVTTNRHSGNNEFIEKIAALNVKLAIHQIQVKSPTLNEMIQNGEIELVGGMYDVETGKIDFYERH
jgi:carbonic anhydrase